MFSILKQSCNDYHGDVFVAELHLGETTQENDTSDEMGNTSWCPSLHFATVPVGTAPWRHSTCAMMDGGVIHGLRGYTGIDYIHSGKLTSGRD